MSARIFLVLSLVLVASAQRYPECVRNKVTSTCYDATTLIICSYFEGNAIRCTPPIPNCFAIKTTYCRGSPTTSTATTPTVTPPITEKTPPITAETPTVPTGTPTQPTDTPTEPTETTTKPTETTTKSTKTTTIPTETTTKSTKTTTIPTETTTKPSETTTIPTETPTIPTESPKESTETTIPTVITETPTIPIESPTEPTVTPTVTTETPKIPTESPTESTETRIPTVTTETPTIPTKSPTEPTETPPTPKTCDMSSYFTECINSSFVRLCIHGEDIKATCEKGSICQSGNCVKPTIPKCPKDDGYFPDFDNFSIFYYCLASQPTKYNCAEISPKSIYCPKRQSCVFGDPNESPLPSCKGKPFGYLVGYPSDPTAYGICGNDGEFMSFGRCPSYTMVSEDSGLCEPACVQEGRIPKNSTSFYDCVSMDLSKKKFFVVAGDCPSNLKFDPERKICM